MRQTVVVMFGLCLCLWLCLCALSQAADKSRTWTDSQGRTMRAQFLREVDGEVTFVKDGKLVALSLDRLCEADQKNIRDLQAGNTPTAEVLSADAPFASSAGDGSALDAAEKVEQEPPSLTKRRLPAIANRVWTLADGQQTTAKFVRVFREQVILLRGSRTAMYSYSALSPADQDYVKEILTARGEEKLIPPPATVVIDGPAPLAEGEAAPPAAAGNDENGEPDAAAAPSATFDELHKRQEDRRAQLAADLDAETSAENALSPADATATADVPQVTPSKRGSAQSAISAEKLAELRPVLIIGGVAIGVLGMVAVIIAAAITIASASGRSRVRRYS